MTMGRLASHIAEMANWAVFTIKQDTLELTPDMKPLNAATKKELMDGARDLFSGCAGSHRRRQR